MIMRVEFVIQWHLTRTGPRLQYKCDEWVDEPLADRPHVFRDEKEARKELTRTRRIRERNLGLLNELRIVKRTFIEEVLP